VNLFALAATQNKGGQAMSKIFSGILGTLAVSLSLGAAQYASGNDLVGLARQPAAVAPTPHATINREAKADRADAPANTLQTKTISVSVDGVSETSILVRVPVARKEARSTSPAEARNTSPAPVLTKKPVVRTMACEPVVSVLTEVAKQLQPGRCVT
jgi:hypothetical protein